MKYDDVRCIAILSLFVYAIYPQSNDLVSMVNVFGTMLELDI